MHTVLLKIVLQRDASMQSSMHSAMLFSPTLAIMISIIVRDCTDVTDVRKSRKKYNQNIWIWKTLQGDTFFGITIAPYNGEHT